MTRTASGGRARLRGRGRLAAAVMMPLLAAPAFAQAVTPPPASQHPSPMVEETRTHERLVQRDLGGVRRAFTGPQGKPVDVWLSDSALHAPAADLVVHFHGAAWLPHLAVSQLGGRVVSAAVNLGAGSGTYDRSFSDPAAFDSLLNGIAREVASARDSARAEVAGRGPDTFERVTLAGFSAGHGAIRAILRDARHFARVDAVLLLDGMHTSYVPERTVLAEGGRLDERNLEAFLRFAQAAMRGDKRFLVTHSEIFPGTFASTTETADHLLRALALRRTPVLRWGPRGMQQLGEARAGGFAVLGFAGNTAPDHIDHLHAMPELLAQVARARR